VLNTASFSNPVFMASNLSVVGNVSVLGVTSLSNVLLSSSAITTQSTLAVLGTASFSNPVFMASNLSVAKNVSVLGVTSLSNALLSSSAITTQSKLTVLDTASFSNPVFMASNLSVMGRSLLQKQVTIGTSNSDSNFSLFVNGDVKLTGTLYQSGTVALGGESTATDRMLIYNTSNESMSFSNASGKTSLYAGSNRLGLNTPAPAFTLDVNGDINFTGTIYQNGAVFSGWESNAAGNYINSNAAFGGKATTADRVLMYNASNESMSFSNATGKTSMYAQSNFLGVGVASPAYRLDVAGTVQAVNARVLNKIYAASNIGIAIESPTFPLDVQANVNGVSINCSAKVLATEFTIYSDRRIKEDVRSVDVDANLDALSRIRVCRFAYVDKVEKGALYKTGLIAQEVEAVLPECVSTVSGYIPDVMKTCSISPVAGDDLVYELGCGAAGFAAAVGTSFKLRASEGSEGTFYGKVVAVTMADESDESASAVTASATISVTTPIDAAVVEVFVVGRHTDDLKMLNFEQLTTITIGALQSQEARLRALEARLA